MQPPVGIELRVLHRGKWRRGMSDGENFWFLEGKSEADSVKLKEIDAFESIDPHAYRPSWHDN